MSGAELRKELHDYIDVADDTFLKMVFAMSREYRKSAVVVTKTKASAISARVLESKVKAVSKKVKAGHITTQEEIENEMRNW